MGLIGLISDTHGLVRPAVFAAFDGVELILHAGDVGEGVLDELRAIAPVRAVLGNTDPSGEGDLVESIEMRHEDVSIHVSHGHELGTPAPEKLLEAYAADVVVYGHTHKQHVFQAGDRWAVNPGAAGPRRFRLQPSVALLRVSGRDVSVRIVELE